MLPKSEAMGWSTDISGLWRELTGGRFGAGSGGPTTPWRVSSDHGSSGSGIVTIEGNGNANMEQQGRS